MTRYIGEPTGMKRLADESAKVTSLAHRPAPVIEAGGAIQYADLEVFNFALGTAMTQVDFTDVGGQNDGVLYTLSAANNLKIASAGFYAVHVLFGGFTLGANVDTVLIAQLNVIAGSVGFWSSEYPGNANEAFTTNLLRVNRNGGSPHDVVADGQALFEAYASWISTNTFPVEIELQAYVEENNAGVAHSPDIRLTCVRVGDTFE